jgi:NTE family protein
VTDDSAPAAGLVLSGGGAYAAYEVGVIRALVNGDSPATGYGPLDPAVVSGTSAGALNAAVMASCDMGDADGAADRLERTWISHIADQPGACSGAVLRLRANALDLLNPNCLAGRSDFYGQFVGDLAYLTEEALSRGAMLVSSPGALRQRLVEAFDFSILLAGGGLREILHAVVDLENVRQSSRAMRVAATNWRTGELRVFGNPEMTEDAGYDVILASSAIPGIFPSVEVEGEPYVDGGVVMNTPLRPAIQAGATELHVIYMDPDVRHVPLPRRRNTMNTLYRMLVISFGLTVSRDIRTAAAINVRLQADARTAHTTVLTGKQRAAEYRPLTIHRYHPSEDLGGAFRWLDFNRDHIIRLIDRGYADARNHDCGHNRCLMPGREEALLRAETAEWARRDA